MHSISYFWHLSRLIYGPRNFQENKRAVVFFARAISNRTLFEELYDFFNHYEPMKGFFDQHDPDFQEVMTRVFLFKNSTMRQRLDALKHHFKGKTTTAYPGVLHCFCARYEEAKQALDQGFLLGINGCFTYKKNEYIREAVKKVGLQHIILETDCPYLSPQGKRGERNDPSNIPLIAQWTADYLNVPVETLAEITTQNTKRLYGLQ